MDTSKYFYRNVIFSKIKNQVSLIDIHNPDNEKQVLEPWFGVVVQLADGQHTIDELFSLLSEKYKGDPPANLKKINTFGNRKVGQIQFNHVNR